MSDMNNNSILEIFTSMNDKNCNYCQCEKESSIAFLVGIYSIHAVCITQPPCAMHHEGRKMEGL